MESFWASFPGGRGGWALLLLRLSVALNVLIYVDGTMGQWPFPRWVAVLIFPVLAVLLGFLTRFSLVVIVGAAMWPQLDMALPIAVRCDPLLYLGVLNSAALALLGPGAYSVDFVLHRRSILILRGH